MGQDIKITDIKFDKGNANKGSERGRYFIESSMREFGFADAGTLDRNNTIIGGNKRTEVAGEIGMEDAIIIDVDGTKPVYIRRNDLDLNSPEDDRARRLAYALNRSAEVSLNWDPEIVFGDLQAGLDLSAMFTDGELDELLEGIQPKGTEGDTEPEIDRAEELRVKWGVEPGMMFALGDHRLICGDCTDAATVARVMGGEKAQAVITDLPYGTTGCAWDSVIDFPVMWDVYQNNTISDSAFVTTSSQPFTSALISSNLEWFKHCWVWNKKLSGNFLQASRQPMKIHEDVCVFSRGDLPYNPQMTKGVMRTKGGNGKSKLWNMGLTASVNDSYYPVSIIEFPNTDRTGKEHPTEKPVELFQYLVGTYTDEDEPCLDFTSGSGTTIIACENLTRRCRAVEISPGYVAVALERWHVHTGKTPVLLEA